ncbi:hypothetical protein ACFORH_04575 [Amycolatopsis roodepoortensis]|uniref:3-deoxy-D-arabino-heptulosonate 7-phosphate (DAHP) synthase n=1 Tax=Amycolatopsis roodepoortensis TaxID=700274 RepID=A0ABR9L6F3_9PSEU|nr:hypothetical protein [Amycolatopsis roodepoortensis]MBE1576278.1 3-deoxy-D-arabino-heptulosonate 7-phosphate (DAHP) synthase [Amycolatopsis roodepoortensis]
MLLKRGMNSTIEEWLVAAEYIAQRGCLDIVLCKRGIRTFETSTRNTLDVSAAPVVQHLSHPPVMIDSSRSDGGRRRRARGRAPASGEALCDGPQALDALGRQPMVEPCRHLRAS